MAGEVAALVRRAGERGERCVIALAAGGTPVATYRELVRLHRDESLSFAPLVALALDDYVGLPEGHPCSFATWLRTHLIGALELEPGALHHPRGWLRPEELQAECRRYEELVAELGGLDLALLGVGPNGHIAFNEPGTDPSLPTHMVALAPETRARAAAAFDGLAHVPTHGITMGLATIAAASRLRLLAFGASKAEAAAALRAKAPAGAADWPVRELRGHDDLEVWLDLEAASL